MSRPNLRSVGTWLLRHRWPILLFLTALALRLHWNLLIHPIEDYYYSDMRGYLRRADAMMSDPWARVEYDAFYPWGTHAMFFVIQWLFGHGNLTAIGVVLAVFGAGIPAMAYLVAARASRWPIIPPAVGLALVFYYPHISLGSYALSEIPFSWSLVTMVYLVLRLMDDPRPRFAYLLGAVVAFGFILRPQILLAVGLLGILWLVYRKHLAITPGLLLRAAIPLVLMMAFSSARLHYHTGRYGLISENSSFNRVFGRCHMKEIKAHPDRPGRVLTGFAPPPYLQIAKRARSHPDHWVQLQPATEMKIVYRGYIGDAQIHQGFIDECIARTGFWGQVRYAAIDVAMLFKYNVMWPDSGRRMWQRQAKRWGKWHERYILWPALLGLLAPFLGKRFLRSAIVAVPVWSIILVAIIFIGSARLRTPYDPFMMILAAQVYVGLAVWVLRLAVRRNTRKDEPVQGSDARPDPEADD